MPNGIALNSADWSFLSTGQPSYGRLSQAAASASYGSAAPTSTKPSSGVIYEFNTECPTLLRLMPYSTVNNATGVGMRVVGWTSALLPRYYTNLITYSQELDNAAWIKSNLAVTGGSINATAAPDGTTTADYALETGAAVTHYIGRDLGAPGASTDIRTHSIYVKGGLGRQYVTICGGNASSGPYYAVTVDLNTGSITQSDLVNTGTWFTTTPSATVTSVGNSWYRVAVTCRQIQYFLTSPSDTATPASGGNWGVGSYTSDVTKGVVLWGGQVEWGTIASPYVTTVASTVQAIDTVNGPTKFYFSTVLADFTLTYSTGTVPSATVNNVPNYLFSTASQVAISPDASIYRPSTVTATNVELASVLVDAIGHELIELQFKANSGSMGALWATI
jgi:hypothetical protein